MTSDAHLVPVDDMGMDCVIVSDATAAGRDDLHHAALDMVCEEGGIFGAVASTADIVSAILTA